ncbi:hypothetical protein GCM10010405_36480 [Streptomyces macrosporus]|uniref:Uncharacterized protein n=1 Tax=Streptomyces macrosporus TaxID=44032 RepID=A0ABN3K547_9ACTN
MESLPLPGAEARTRYHKVHDLAAYAAAVTGHSAFTERFADEIPHLWSPVTEVGLVLSCSCSGGSDGQAGLGEAAVDEVAAVPDVP